jgi:hypothetical protein
MDVCLCFDDSRCCPVHAVRASRVNQKLVHHAPLHGRDAAIVRTLDTQMLAVCAVLKARGARHRPNAASVPPHHLIEEKTARTGSSPHPWTIHPVNLPPELQTSVETVDDVPCSFWTRLATATCRRVFGEYPTRQAHFLTAPANRTQCFCPAQGVTPMSVLRSCIPVYLALAVHSTFCFVYCSLLS